MILNAHDGAAFPEETESKNPGSNVQPGLNCGSAQEKPPKVPSLVIQNYVYEAFCLPSVFKASPRRRLGDKAVAARLA